MQDCGHFKRMISQRTYPRKNTDFNYSQSHSHDDYDYRSMHQSAQPHLQQKKIFGFQIFVDNDILAEIGNTQQWFSNAIRTHHVEYIKFNPDLTIPDLNGRNIQIYDIEMQKKYQCSKTMLNDIYMAFKRIKREAFSIMVFVPEGMVSLLIGTKGHQINKIMRESHTTIVVNQPISRMTYRTAKIQGYHSDIAKACRIIYEILEEKSCIAYSIEKEPSQLDYSKSKVKAKFIFSQAVISFLERKKKALLSKIEAQVNCSIRFESDRQNQLLKRQQGLCILFGRLQDVQAMLVMIINIAHEYLCEQRRNIDYTLKMLIPGNYVTKLIGQRGYMIRNIIERSGGAQIKILSDKQTERDIKECIISINGMRQNKIDACCLILQQIECFKNGGPILISGKSINQNLAQQFNSILAHEDIMDIEKAENSGVTTVVSPQIKPILQPQIKPILQREQTPQIKPMLQPTISQPTINLKSKKDVNSEEEGLIKAEEDDKVNARKERKQKRKHKKQNQNYISLVQKNDQLSQKSSSSHSKSRSRDKNMQSKLAESYRKQQSNSPSVEFKHDRQFTQVKMVIPKRLSQDYKQLKYIESLCKAEIILTEQKVQETGESIISIRGSLKDNCYCIELLQKRLARMKGIPLVAR